MYESSMELTMLMWASVLYVVQILIAALAADMQNGPAWGIGNREETPELEYLNIWGQSKNRLF